MNRSQASQRVSSGPPLCQFHTVRCLHARVSRGTVSACEDVAFCCHRHTSCLTGKSEAEQKRGAAGAASCSGDHLSFYRWEDCVNKSPQTEGVCQSWCCYLFAVERPSASASLMMKTSNHSPVLVLNTSVLQECSLNHDWTKIVM